MISVILFSVAVSACAPVQGALLRAKDLAAADQRFSSAPPDDVIGYAPGPGARRMFSEAEVARLGRRFGVEGKGRQVCFEYAMRPLERAEVVAAIETAMPGAAAEIVDNSNLRVPEGRVVFPRSSLPKPPQSRPNDPVVWRGYVEYAEGRRFTIWSSVRLTVATTRVFAKTDIPAGREIAACDVEVRSLREFPDAGHWVESTAEAVGHRTSRSIRAETAIPLGSLIAGGQAVSRGDEVRVEVLAGYARLQVDARAEGNASVGDLVKLRNPKSGRVFEARVTGKDAASVTAGVGGAQ